MAGAAGTGLGYHPDSGSDSDKSLLRSGSGSRSSLSAASPAAMLLPAEQRAGSQESSTRISDFALFDLQPAPPLNSAGTWQPSPESPRGSGDTGSALPGHSSHRLVSLPENSVGLPLASESVPAATAFSRRIGVAVPPPRSPFTGGNGQMTFTEERNTRNTTSAAHSQLGQNQIAVTPAAQHRRAGSRSTHGGPPPTVSRTGSLRLSSPLSAMAEPWPKAMASYTFTAPPKFFLLLMLQKLGVPAEVHQITKVGEGVIPCMTLILTPEVMKCSKNLLGALGEVVNELARQQETVSAGQQEPSAYDAIIKRLYPKWERASGLLSVLYGLGFAMMVFSLSGNLQYNMVGVVFTLTAMAIILGVPSAFVNAMQTDTALPTLAIDVHAELSPLYPSRLSRTAKAATSAIILSSLLYLFMIPGAALVSETVRQGMLRMANRPVDSNSSESLDFGIFEVFMQLMRAAFLTKMFITFPRVWREAINSIGDRDLTVRQRDIAACALIASSVLGVIYGVITASKTKEGLDNNQLSIFYPDAMRETMMVTGTTINTVVAIKLLLAGMLDLIKIQQSRRLTTALILAIATCAAGLATGGATAVSSLAGSGVFNLRSMLVIAEIIFNFIYAGISNLPFLLKATGAEMALTLENQRVYLRELYELIPSIRANNNLQILRNDLEAVIDRVDAAINEVKISRGLQNVLALTLRLLGYRNSQADIMRQASEAAISDALRSSTDDVGGNGGADTVTSPPPPMAREIGSMTAPLLNHMNATGSDEKIMTPQAVRPAVAPSIPQVDELSL